MERQLHVEIKNHSLLRCAHVQSDSTDLYSRIRYLTLATSRIDSPMHYTSTPVIYNVMPLLRSL